MQHEAPLLASWLEAGEDLGVKVEEHGDAVVVREFGNSLGMLCSLAEDGAAHKSDAKQLGMGYSLLGKSYVSYDRALFIDTLNDWGWYGQGDPPPWYTGEPWTE
jgi:hypothetical protein